jgi:Leucine-rich repeat (LRR) protein
MTIEGMFKKNLCFDESGKSVKNISDIDSVERITLYNEKLISIPAGLENFKNLKNLSLYGNKITSLKNLEGCVNLENLDISENRISKIEGLENCVNLRNLILDHNRITKIEGLEKLINLEELNLSNNKISKIEGLNSLKKLEFLWIEETNITTIENLFFLKNLQGLFLKFNEKLRFSKYKDFSFLPKLEKNIELEDFEEEFLLHKYYTSHNARRKEKLLPKLRKRELKIDKKNQILKAKNKKISDKNIQSIKKKEPTNNFQNDIIFG